MEGGNPVLEWITYAILAFVLLALAALAVRTLSVVLSILAIPLTSALCRVPLFRDAVYRWGERGSATLPGHTLGPAAEAARAEAEAGRPRAPLPVRRGMRVGALVGALPGVWIAMRGVQQALSRGDVAAAVAAGLGITLGLVAAAGTLVGIAVGAVVGLAIDALRGRALPAA